MRQRNEALAIPSDNIDDFAEDIRAVFQALGRAFSAESLVGECSPAIDVYETDDTLEVVTDLPGVAATAVHIVAKGDALLIAGEKAPRRVRGESTFRLVERGYGRFARVVRLGRACDMTRARARIADGELRITIPKVADRRSRRIPIPIT